jgi:serine/threonine protein kinase
MSDPDATRSDTPMETSDGRPRPASQPGAHFGRFVVLDTLGMGGMGLVLAAYDPQLDRRVALKLLRPDKLGGATARQRLQREAQAMARLAHPNVVTVFEVGAVDEQIYIAMEYVEGETLRAWLKREERAWPEVVELFAAAGRGLAAAHASGLVHRDFKPDNVLVGQDGRVRVTDFGVASTSARSLARADAEELRGLPSDELYRELTLEGMVLGTCR